MSQGTRTGQGTRETGRSCLSHQTDAGWKHKCGAQTGASVLASAPGLLGAGPKWIQPELSSTQRTLAGRWPCPSETHHSPGSPVRTGSDSQTQPSRPPRLPPAKPRCRLQSRRTRWRPLCPLGRSSTPRRCRQCRGSCGPDFHSAKQSRHHSP